MVELHIKRPSVVVGDGDMCSVGIAHKRHRKGASERTEKLKEDEVYAGSKEKKKAPGSWKRKDMPRSDPSNESLLIDELTGCMLSAPPEPKLSGFKEKGRKTRKKKLSRGSKEKKALGNWKRMDMPRSDPSNEHLLIVELTGYMLYAPREPILDDPAENLADQLDEADRDLMILEADERADELYTYMRKLKADVLKEYHTIGFAGLHLQVTEKE